MSLEYIIAGDYGQTIVLTVKDVDTAAAADISAYSDSVEVELKDPYGTVTTKTAAFSTDGSDGLVEYALADGDIDAGGTWRIRAKVTKTGQAVLTSQWVEFDVQA